MISPTRMKHFLTTLLFGLQISCPGLLAHRDVTAQVPSDHLYCVAGVLDGYLSSQLSLNSKGCLTMVRLYPHEERL